MAVLKRAGVGDTIGISLNLFGRDPEFWPDPEGFDPVWGTA
jgi:hypothetical protein